jgi:molecular chaperone DnaJ
MIRLRGEGLPHLQYRGVGDLYIRLVANLPSKLNREQRKAVEALQKAGL